MGTERSTAKMCVTEARTPLLDEPSPDSSRPEDRGILREEHKHGGSGSTAPSPVPISEANAKQGKQADAGRKRGTSGPAPLRRSFIREVGSGKEPLSVRPCARAVPPSIASRPRDRGRPSSFHPPR